MLKLIRNLFRNSVPEEIAKPLLDTRDQALDESDSYYYLDLYIKGLPKNKMYTIHEHCAGKLLKHKFTETDDLFTYSDMNWYVRSIFLPEHPHRLVIRSYPVTYDSTFSYNYAEIA